ncbi:MAG: NAD-dependent epimerase/dehydratase family protein [Candidatus Aenigmatarchaeota archaeon]
MILITGASGRIGRAFANFMAKRGEEVRALIRSEYKGTGLSGVEVRVADLLDKEAVKKACEGVGTVYHLAALLDYEASQEDLRKNNVEATRNLLEECRGKKFVYLSS